LLPCGSWYCLFCFTRWPVGLSTACGLVDVRGGERFEYIDWYGRVSRKPWKLVIEASPGNIENLAHARSPNQPWNMDAFSVHSIPVVVAGSAPSGGFIAPVNQSLKGSRVRECFQACAFLSLFYPEVVRNGDSVTPCLQFPRCPGVEVLLRYPAPYLHPNYLLPNHLLPT
jgi:hypothetical protein